jgi:hypothetical protein
VGSVTPPNAAGNEHDRAEARSERESEVSFASNGKRSEAEVHRQVV